MTFQYNYHKYLRKAVGKIKETGNRNVSISELVTAIIEDFDQSLHEVIADLFEMENLSDTEPINFTLDNISSPIQTSLCLTISKIIEYKNSAKRFSESTNLKIKNETLSCLADQGINVSALLSFQDIAAELFCSSMLSRKLFVNSMNHNIGIDFPHPSWGFDPFFDYEMYDLAEDTLAFLIKKIAHLIVKEDFDFIVENLPIIYEKFMLFLEWFTIVGPEEKRAGAFDGSRNNTTCFK